MCGIWGAINVSDEAQARRAIEAIAHRGPDDNGLYISTERTPAMLGNTRLSIIDLSDAGHMPMSDITRRYWIAYNGEAYNYQALRTILRDMGHSFHSDTDTEVILHAYMEWGAGCLDHLRGMFAFAIWDNAEQKLFAARDRLGIKPLYYVHSPVEDQFAFASELKALVAAGLARRTIDYNALHHYLSFYAVPSPYTMLADVRALEPGHYLTYHEGRLRMQRYWEIPAIEYTDMPQGEILVRLRDLLEEAIQLRMVADVPVGAFLSGGIDSAAVVALMTRATGDQLKTFSIGFGDEGRDIDERSAARTIAQRYGTDHHEVVISGQHVRDELDSIICAMDQPTGDGLNTYLVSQAASRFGKVALSGLGGDELFAGYPQFRMFQQADRAAGVWRKLPAPLQNVARGAANALRPAALNWVDGDLLDRYERVRFLFDDAGKRSLYTPDTIRQLAAPEQSRDYLQHHFVHPAETDTLAQLTRLELHNYMTHTLLRDTDAMSMAHSLEVRVPLIDHKLVEFAVRIPPHLKLREGRGKWILTAALQDVLPAEVINRPKRGFEMPVATWMRTTLADVLEDVFSPQSIEARGLFQPEAVQAIYQDFKDQTAATYMHTWALAVFELWLRCTIDQVSVG